VQVDPIKLELKAPETAKTNHLTLKRDGLLSTVAFKINLRRNSQVRAAGIDMPIIALTATVNADELKNEVERCKLHRWNLC
jgi:hypothetical protein